MTDVTAESYPSECTVSDEELRDLKETLTDEDNEDWRSYVESWPPTDDLGNVYPIFFTVEELTDERGELTDPNGNEYSPFSGNLEPRHYDGDGKFCNTPLQSWRSRYPEIRYCAGYVDAQFDQLYCHIHNNREELIVNPDEVKSAEEFLQTGLHTKSVDHLYAKLDPWKKLLGWGIYESLMGESQFDFAVEYEVEQLDFSEAMVVPDNTDEDGVLTFSKGYPTEYVDRALSLYVAAMIRVQMLTVQPRIMEENREDGQGMMESKTIEAAQLTAPPSEHDPSPQEYKTLETWSEHHLNLPFSRLFNDLQDALEMGGVVIDPEGESDDVDDSDIVLEIDADGENIQTSDDTGTDPNAFGEDLTAESQKIADKATSDGDDSA